jgi:thiol-disulfide isomerase/thioredoxin
MGALALVLTLSAQSPLPSTGLRGIAYGAPPPDFAFDVGSGTQRLSALAGKVVVIHFWASWCAPCVLELPLFERLQSMYGDRVTIVTLGWKEDPQTSRDFLAGRHSALPLVPDAGRAIAVEYGIESIPTTLVLGRDGTVTHVSVGALEWDELDYAVEAALASPQTLTPGTRSDTLMQNAGTH